MNVFFFLSPPRMNGTCYKKVLKEKILFKEWIHNTYFLPSRQENLNLTHFTVWMIPTISFSYVSKKKIFKLSADYNDDVLKNIPQSELHIVHMKTKTLDFHYDHRIG